MATKLFVTPESQRKIQNHRNCVRRPIRRVRVEVDCGGQTAASPINAAKKLQNKQLSGCKTAAEPCKNTTGRNPYNEDLAPHHAVTI